MKSFFPLLLLTFIVVSRHGSGAIHGKSVKYHARNIEDNVKLPIYKSKDIQNLSPDGKSLTFIVHDSQTTTQMIQQMQTEMARVVYDITSQYPKWIKTFQLLYFNSHTITQVGETNDANAFLTDFKEFATQNFLNTTEATCKNLPVLSSLYIALVTSSKLYANSNIYVFMNGIIGDYSNGLYSSLLNLITHSQTKINFIQSNPYPCGEALSAAGPHMMWKISSQSGGGTYVIAPQNIPAFLKTISSHYQNSQITEASFEDCSKEKIIKFSVDSETQIVNIVINGEISGNPIYIYPNEYNGESIINAFNDYSTNERFDQIIGTCNSDDGYYVYMNGRCWGYNTYRLTWYQARDYCHEHGGALMNILDDSDQKLLYESTGTVSYWIGLNDLQREGNFVWDYNQNSSTPLSYTNWRQSEPNVNVGGCVTDSAISKWKVKSCNDTNISICTRNYYNSSTPVMPGLWTLKVKTYEGSCSAKITTQSNIFIYPAFVQDEQDDIGEAIPVSGTNNFVIAHVDGLLSLNRTTKGELKSVSFKNGVKKFTLKMYLRDSSSFKHEYISDAFECLSGKMTFTGVDSNGYDFTRVHPVTCFDGSSKF